MAKQIQKSRPEKPLYEKNIHELADLRQLKVTKARLTERPLLLFSSQMNGAMECFWVALRLGLTSFGGPVAHVSYFREEYVARRGWINESRFGELMSLTQFIPGPGSSQLGAAIGYERAGLLGGLAAWIGFTLPSALVLVLVALGMGDLPGDHASGAVRGLKLVALAVVAGAWLGMRSSLAPDLRRLAISVIVFVMLWIFTAPWITVVMITLAGLAGVFTLSAGEKIEKEKTSGRGMLGWLAMIAFFVILFFSIGSSDPLAGIYRAGSLVFGGGHVVLPLLQESMVDGGYMEKEIFLGGYGATQGVPGPVFTFAAFLGVKVAASPDANSLIFGNPWLGAGAALIAVFLPGMLLLGGTMKIWGGLRGKRWAQRAVKGANAGVVGVLGVALLHMATDDTLNGWTDALGVAILFLILRKKLIPVWALVLIAAGGGALLA
ncbi:MAG: chromate transporter [Akkermansiaceae bacterium]|jgi:chromate transporter|tara:strand:+ start:5119 stop:6426 length:1308 start_codon:yes stop_codon:yes gene_type:complete